jgi:hypothetical protein
VSEMAHFADRFPAPRPRRNGGILIQLFEKQWNILRRLKIVVHLDFLNIYLNQRPSKFFRKVPRSLSIFTIQITIIQTLSALN